MYEPGYFSTVRLALPLLTVALAAFVVNFLGATGGHCDDSGCSGNFPEWLYVGSGWLVLLSVAALLVVLAVGLVRRARSRTG
jgi:hypothetical protein